MEKIANLLGVSTSFWSPYSCNFPFCGRRCCKTSICISCCSSRWFTCTKPIKLSTFTFPPSTFSNSCWTDGYWFSSISPFAMFTKFINDFTIPFGAFSLFMIPFTWRMHWPPAVFTVLTKLMFGRLVSHV